jgi:hypothetical protein
MWKAVIFASLLVVSAFGALAPTSSIVCPSNGGQLELLAAGAPSGYSSFIPNVFVYTGNGQPLMTGTPLGPYIGNFANCVFVPNSTLSCSFTIYNDSALTLPIGTGSFSGSDFFVVSTGGVNFFGGDLLVTTDITSSPFPDASDASTVNFRSGTYTIHYEASQIYPAVGSSQAALLNTIQYTSSTSGFISLWGSNGWNGSSYSSSRTTGLDLRFSFSCPSVQPIIPPAECPCTSSADVYSLSSGCASAGATILRSSSSTCIGLDFVASSSTSSC